MRIEIDLVVVEIKGDWTAKICAQHNDHGFALKGCVRNKLAICKHLSTISSGQLIGKKIIKSSKLDFHGDANMNAVKGGKQGIAIRQGSARRLDQVTRPFFNIERRHFDRVSS